MEVRNMFKPVTMNTESKRMFNYHLYLPKGYNDSNKAYPLILFLHGAGERGDSITDLDKVLVNGIPQYINKTDDFPFIVVMPQCPTNAYWPMEVHHLNHLLDEVIANYRIDQDRVYLTGLSMGGYGTWYMAFAYLERFAAIAPVCGAGIRSSAQRLSNIPIWVFHGDKDPIVPVEESDFLVRAIKEQGGAVKYTRYEGMGHGSWVPAYDNPELYEWFLSHKRNNK